MKKYYNSTTNKWYNEGSTITISSDGSLFSGVPTEQQLLAWGYEECHEPEPTQEELLERAKQSKISEIEAYDASEEVNSFIVGGKEMWLDAATRQQLRISLDAMKQAGRETVSKWFDGVEYTYPIDVWYYMLGLVEVYAADALNVTESHKAAVNALSTIEAIEAYDYTEGYPGKLVF